MDSFKNLLVAVDLTEGSDDGPSAESRAALSQAQWISEACGSTVCLMTVLTDAGDKLVDLARFQLQQLAEQHFPDRKTVVEVSTGAVFVDVVRKVLRDGHDLLVVGPRAESRRHRGDVGSTARRMVSKCPCPVFVAPRTATDRPVGLLSAIAWHDATPRILSISAALCAETGAAWNVLHVPEYPMEGGMRLRNAPESELDSYRKEVREAAWAKLHENVDPVGTKAGVEPKLYMSEGLASEQIADAVQELKPDVVVIGTVERHGLAGLLLGSTAVKLLDEIETGLLVIKPDDFVSPITLD